MGIIYLFLLALIPYFIIKVVMLVMLIIFAIYIIVKKSKKKRLGKGFTITFSVILIILELLTCPLDIYAAYTSIDTAKLRSDVRNERCAYRSGVMADDFTYKGKKYVHLSSKLDKVDCVRFQQPFYSEFADFEKVTVLVDQHQIKNKIWFLWGPDTADVYKLKGEESDSILYCNIDGIWCIEAEQQALIKKYNNRKYYDYYIEYEVGDVKKQQAISLSVFEKIIECHNNDEAVNDEYFSILPEDGTQVELYAISKDGCIHLRRMCDNLVMINSKLYYTQCFVGSELGKDLNVTLK